MWKSFLSVFLSVCILSALFCVPVNAANISSKSSPVITEKLYFTYNDITEWYGPTKSINILDDISYLVDLDSIVSIDLDVIIPELYNVNWEYNGKNYISGIYISLNDFKFDTAWGLTTLHSSINVNDLISNNVVESSFAELSNFDIVVFDINPSDPSVVDGLEVLYYFTVNYLVDESDSGGIYDDISDSTSYIFYGDALYQLLSTGIWSCGYIVDGVDYPAVPASMSYDTDDYGVVMSFMPENYSIPGSLSKSNIVLSFDADYDNVIAIESSVASTLTYKDAWTNTPTFVYAKSAYMGAVDKNGILNYGTSVNFTDDALLGLEKVSYYDFDGSNRYLRENIPLLPLIINNNTLKNASISSVSYNITHNLSNLGEVYFVCESICINKIEFKVEGVMSTKLNAVISALEDTNIKIDKVADKVDGLTYIVGEMSKDIIDNQDQNTQDIINNQNQNTQDIIDNDDKLWSDTYDPSEEDVADLQDGINDVTDELKEKLGLFTFIDNTLSQFFDLLDPDLVSSTNMIFPSLSITVQGQSYEFVEETEYDISSLKDIDGFDPLFTALHFFSVAIIYWALIDYLQKVFKRIFASGSGDEQ